MFLTAFGIQKGTYIFFSPSAIGGMLQFFACCGEARGIEVRNDLPPAVLRSCPISVKTLRGRNSATAIESTALSCSLTHLRTRNPRPGHWSQQPTAGAPGSFPGSCWGGGRCVYYVHTSSRCSVCEACGRLLFCLPRVRPCEPITTPPRHVQPTATASFEMSST